MIDIDIQKEYINKLMKFQDETFKKLVKNGLELKGFKFESDEELFKFIKKYCTIFKDIDLDMTFYCKHKSFNGNFLFIKDPNKFELEPNLESGKINMEIQYSFL